TSIAARATAPPPPKAAPPPAAAGPTHPQPRLPAGAGPIRVVVKNEKPAQPLSPAERRARSLENMEKIGRALTAYVAKYGRLPPQSFVARDGKKTLSWRVAILPELGYQ